MNQSEPLVKSEELSPEEAAAEPQIGGFIQHYTWEGAVPQTKGIEYCFAADHDVLSIKNQQKNEFLDAFEKGRESYVSGDWINAQTALNMALA